MKKSKVLILFLLIFLICGCSVDYNLEIKEDSFIESTNLNTNVNDQEKIDDRHLIEIFTEKQNVRISFKNADFGEANENDKRYANTNFSNGDIITTNFKNTFVLDNFYLSRAIKECYNEFSIAKSDDIFTLKTNMKAHCFETYNLLTNLTINIKIDYEVVFSNADAINDNVYTWYVNKENYTFKPLTLVYDTVEDIIPPANNDEVEDEKENKTQTKKSEEQSTPKEKISKPNPIIILIYGLIIGFIILLIIIFIKRKNDQANKI